MLSYATHTTLSRRSDDSSSIAKCAESKSAGLFKHLTLSLEQLNVLTATALYRNNVSDELRRIISAFYGSSRR